VFIDGEVPVAPYPDWSQSDTALASIARLLRGLHDAARRFDPQGLTWDDALVDPAGGTLACHHEPFGDEPAKGEREVRGVLHRWEFLRTPTIRERGPRLTLWRAFDERSVLARAQARTRHSGQSVALAE
jgi:hypothetical protein